MATEQDDLDDALRARELSARELARLTAYFDKTSRLRALFPLYFHMREEAGRRIKTTARCRDVLGQFATDRKKGYPARCHKYDVMLEVGQQRPTFLRVVRS